MDTSYTDLVLDNGELIRIECPDKYMDELSESIDNTRKRGDWFSVNQFDGCKAEYMGMGLDLINMKRVIGTM